MKIKDFLMSDQNKDQVAMKIKDFLMTDQNNDQVAMTTTDHRATIRLVKILNPDSDSKRAAIELKKQNAVIADCTKLKANQKESASRFLTGACFMANSQMLTIAPQIYLLTPSDILVDSDDDHQDIVPEMNDSDPASDFEPKETDE